MESPVMTSASSHRLRSAVSACAQPTHSYLSPSRLSSSVRVESHDSGGCFKKFNGSGKNGEDSSLNVARKSSPGGEFSPLHKRRRTGGKHGSSHRRAKRHGKEVENSSSDAVLNLIPKRLMLGEDFLSKLKFGGKLIESKRLADYLEKSSRSESVATGREKVIGERSGHKNNKKNASDGKALNHRRDDCGKGKRKASAGAGAKDGVEEKSGDDRSRCGEGIRDERQEISKWQPKHVVTRRTAQIVRGIRNAWQSRVGTSKSVPAEYVRDLFKDLQLFPSTSEVYEMLKCPGKPPAESVTFVEFYRIANNFIKFDKLCKAARASPTPGILDKNDEKRARKFSKGMSKYEVFLGGSCNPTTWRTDFAIPELEKMGISYYNPVVIPNNSAVFLFLLIGTRGRPLNIFQCTRDNTNDRQKQRKQQVEEWRPELMEVEYHAKENATVMFFVLDNQTRGVSALIEVAHLAGNRRKLILVIQSYAQQNQRICDEEISKEECEELKRGQEVLRVLVERQGIPVFRNIHVALECTEKILRENLRVQDLRPPVHVTRETFISPREAFEKVCPGNPGGRGEISADDACLALKILTGVELSDGGLKSLIAKAGKELNGTLVGDVKFDFEYFSELAAEFKRQLEEGTSLDSSSGSGSCCKHVYLGGTIENTSWRESIAIPALEEKCLSYFVPKINEGGKRFAEIEAAAMDNSFLLLFVITNTARSIAAMAIAGHYIGKGANVVLCVEHLPENATVGGEKLSENAVKDYNRGRMYLMDIAERSDVPVFDDISKAVKFVVQNCRNR